MMAAGSQLVDLTPEQLDNYVQLCLRRGDAPIKPKYLQAVTSNRPEDYPPLRNVLQRDTAEDSCVKEVPQRESDLKKRSADESIVREADPKKNTVDHARQRGQNKDRTGNTAQIQALNSQQLCSVIAATDGCCNWAEHCRFLHDREAFIANKPADLGPTCTEFERVGVCRYGVNCRFGGCHIANGFNVDKEGHRVTLKAFEQAKRMKAQEESDLSEELRIGLRKRTYTFRTLPNYSDNRKRPQQSLDKDSDTVQSNPINCDPPLGASNSPVGPAVTLDATDRVSMIQQRRDAIFCSGKLLLAPLTTLGNLPFRRLCVSLGAEVTMSEMAMASSIVEGKPSELALLKRHSSEKLFGVQLACGQPRILAQCASFLENEVACDFIDLNAACPLEPLHKKMAGSILMARTSIFEQVVQAFRLHVQSLPITVKMRTGYGDKRNAIQLLPRLEELGVDAFFIHGRTSRQRYTKQADWDYLNSCKAVCQRAAVIGNGDIMSWEDYQEREMTYHLDNILIGRGALIKPWIFTELQEHRLWDISAQERFDIMKRFVNNGLEHWGTDTRGVETTRRYFLEMCSFSHRYIPVGLLERLPQSVNWRPPVFVGRNDLETLMASSHVKDWIKLSEMLLGPVPTEFSFVPKHKSNAYE